MKTNKEGFGSVEIILLILVIGLISVIGWLVYDRQNNKSEESVSVSTQENNQEKQVEVSETDSSTDDNNVLEFDEIKYTVPSEWINTKSPYEPYESAAGNYLLSPDYKEAGEGQLFISSGSYILFQDLEKFSIGSSTSVDQAVETIKNNAEGSYIEVSSVKVNNINGKQVITYDSGHTTDNVTVLYKTDSGKWLEVIFSTISDSPGYHAQTSTQYPVFQKWLEEFVTLN